MLRLIRFSEYFGRQGTLESLFVADDEDWEQIQAMIENKRELMFYEALGKHSQPRTAITNKNINVISDDQDFVKKFAEIMGYHVSGIDLLSAIGEELWQIEQEEAE